MDALEAYARFYVERPPHGSFEAGTLGMKISVPDNTFGRYDHLPHVVAPLPAGPRRANTYGHSAGVIGLVIGKSTPEKQKAALRALEWLYSPEAYVRLCLAIQALPVTHSGRYSPVYRDHLARHPDLAVFLDEMEWAVPRPCIPEFRFMGKVLREVLLPVQVEPRTATTRQDYSDIMTDAAKKVNDAMAGVR